LFLKSNIVVLKPPLNQLPKLAKISISRTKSISISSKKAAQEHRLCDAGIARRRVPQNRLSRVRQLCKTTGRFSLLPIERIAKHLRQKPQQFIDQYLRIDEENDYVLKSVLCAFLDSQNYCMIYDVRPKACREFPHTDRKIPADSQSYAAQCGDLPCGF
jgi:Fe-S-cluster containining protein